MPSVWGSSSSGFYTTFITTLTISPWGEIWCHKDLLSIPLRWFTYLQILLGHSSQEEECDETGTNQEVKNLEELNLIT